MAAKQKTHVNKSQMIRDMLKANPDMSPSEIAAELKKQGLDINAQYVSTIKSNAKVHRKQRRAPAMRSVAQRTARLAGAELPTAEMEAAINLLRTAGGLERAQAVLSFCERVKQVV